MEPIKINVTIEIDPKAYLASKKRTLGVLGYELESIASGIKKVVLKERTRLMRESVGGEGGEMSGDIKYNSGTASSPHWSSLTSGGSSGDYLTFTGDPVEREMMRINPYSMPVGAASFSDWTNQYRGINNPTKEGIEMKNLYEVIGVYGEDGNKPVVFRELAIIASDEEDAKVKCGIYKWLDEKCDADYLTIIVRNLGAVKVKEKAKEVKNV